MAYRSAWATEIAHRMSCAEEDRYQVWKQYENPLDVVYC